MEKREEGTLAGGKAQGNEPDVLARLVSPQRRGWGEEQWGARLDMEPDGGNVESQAEKSRDEPSFIPPPGFYRVRDPV